MKRIIVFAVFVLIVVSNAKAISSDLKDSYLQRETMIGKFSGNILSPITREQVSLVKDGHIQVGFDYGVKEINGEQFIWLSAPQNFGNYTLIIRDILAIQDGAPQIIEYRKDFSVGNISTDYSIKPGIIYTSDDFEIESTLYEDIGKTISVSFPEARSVVLNPGVNEIEFSIENVVGEQLIQISVGKYSVPAFVIGNESFCGDGRIDGREVCDGNNLSGKSCVTIQGGFIGGNLHCSSNCLSFNTSDCEFEEGAECDSEHLRLCLNSESCLGFDGYWYNGVCNKKMPETGCDSKHLENCLSQEECENAQGVWQNGLCKSSISLFPPNFEFNPKIIKSTVLASESLPTYVFEIRNLGEGPISGIELGYDKRVFSISPESNIFIEPNKSAQFNLALVNVTGGGVRGVIFANYGGLSKYLLFKLSFTSNQSQVSTDYLRDDSENPGYYCSEIPGSTGAACGADEVCSGEEVSSLDVTKCCVGTCEAQSGQSKAWIGYLIAAILILGVLLIYLKYKKTGKKKDPLNQKVSELEKKLP